MDKLLNEFTVNRPIDETWTVLTDVERIAPCMPGAQLEEIDGDVFRGVVKVKVGAIATAFKGQASFVERDDVGHRAVLHGEGRDTGGKGNADAMITATLESLTAGSTKCVVETDLRITGKVAQFGRGIMGDISKKLMTQFATNLNSMLDDQDAPSAAPAQMKAAPPEDKVEAPRTVRKIEGPAAEPIELSGVAGPAILKRALPLFGGLALLLLLIRRLRK